MKNFWYSHTLQMSLEDKPGLLTKCYGDILQQDFHMELMDYSIDAPFTIKVVENPFNVGEPQHLGTDFDYLIRTEYLDEDLKHLYLTLGKKPSLSSFSIPSSPMYFTEEEINSIRELCADDFLFLNYPKDPWYPPGPLINGVRFDLAAKLIYADYRMRSLKTTWHLDLYKNHILTFNGGWEWPGGIKDSVDDFVKCFDNLIDNFDPKKAGVIPLSEDGVIANGSHRVAVAYLKGLNLRLVIKEKERRPYDYNFFMNRKKYGYPDGTPQKNLKWALKMLDIVYANEMALEFCRRCPDLRIVTLFPKAEGCKKEVVELLKTNGEIIYEIGFGGDQMETVLSNLIKEFYRGEPWVASNPEERFFAPNVAGKANQCWNPENPVIYSYLWAPFDLSKCQSIKEQIRDLYKVANHSVHINDTHEETLRIAGMLFNQNSIQMFRHKISIPKTNQKMFKKYFEDTKDDPDSYCITGSFVLALYGIREAKDLDYICHGRPAVGMGSSHNQYAFFYDTTLDDIIYNPKNHFYFAGRKVATLEVVRKMKEKRGELKDIADIKNIDILQGQNKRGVIERPEIKVPHGSIDIHQITFYKNGQRLENYHRHNTLLKGYVNFFEASDTTVNINQSIQEGLQTQTYNPKIKRFADMIKTCPGKIGCNLSHYYLYIHLLEKSPVKWHLILEDDIDMVTDPIDTLNNLVKSIETKGIDTHYIKLITFEEFVKDQFTEKHKIPEVEGLYQKIHDWGTGAQLISNEGLKILLNKRPWDFIDNTINNIHKELKCTCFYNKIFEHKGTESGIPFDPEKKPYGSLIYGQTTKQGLKCDLGFPPKKPSVSKFTHGWFHPSVAQTLRHILRFYNVHCLLELGTWYGQSALDFAQYIDKVYCVDLWDERYIRECPRIGFKDYEIFKDHPLYETFISNAWEMKDRIIPIKCGTLKGIEKVKYLPFKPQAVYIDAEHSYEAVSKELSAIFEAFGHIIIFGNADNPEVMNAVNEFRKRHKIYTFEKVHNCFLMVPVIGVYYTGFWSEFNPKKTYLQRLFPTMNFTSSKSDISKVNFIYKSDYGGDSYDTLAELGLPIVAYSAESWFKPSDKHSLEITLRNSTGNNLQLRNYERIYFERFGKTDVYSNIPSYAVSKSKFCSFVVKNPNCWQRNSFFSMLDAKQRVSSLGPHLHNVDFTIPKRDPYSKSQDDYLKILGEYRFCICFENTSQKGYLTEKLYNAMKSGTVPIYWGDTEALNIFNPESFIYIPTFEDKNQQIKAFEVAVERILYLEEHPEEYKAMLAQPRVLNVGKENHRVGQVLEQIKERVSALF